MLCLAPGPRIDSLARPNVARFRDVGGLILPSANHGHLTIDRHVEDYMALRDSLVATRNILALRAMPHSDHVHFLRRSKMYIDQEDSRGRGLLRAAGSSRLRNSLLWSAAVKRIRPEIVLDVGANYGEVGLSARYPKGTEIVFIEANPRLADLLHRSCTSLLQEQATLGVTVRAVAAGARSEGEVDFFIDATSSAESRLNGLHNHRSYSTVPVPVMRIDDIVSEMFAQSVPSTVLFKMDIEGGETDAIQGMAQTLKRAGTFLGIVELSRANQEASGHSIEVFWDELRCLGSLWLFDRRFALHDCTSLTWSEIEKVGPDKGLIFDSGADVIVARGIDSVRQLAPNGNWHRAERVAKLIVGRR